MCLFLNKTYRSENGSQFNNEVSTASNVYRIALICIKFDNIILALKYLPQVIIFLVETAVLISKDLLQTVEFYQLFIASPLNLRGRSFLPIQCM